MSTTFQVSAKASKDLGTEALPAVSVGEYLTTFLEAPVEASGGNAPSVIRTGRGDLNGLLGAAHLSFARHYPLVLSPDAIWLAIAQGFATHVEANAEGLRKHFVQHEGQKTILHMNNYKKGDPNNPWPESFKFFSDEIEKHIGKKRDLLVSNFSTTGPIEKAASEVVLMGAMKDYFKYREMTLCGIPEITLLGTVDDWKNVRARASTLAEFELSWWTDALLPILDHFVNASQGRANASFWDSFYKPGGGSGGPKVTGWVNTFYPYLEGGRKNPCATEQNGWWISTAQFPSGISKVPFVWDYLGTEFKMEFLGGFVGTHQAENLSIQPSIGWAVRDEPST